MKLNLTTFFLPIFLLFSCGFCDDRMDEYESNDTIDSAYSFDIKTDDHKQIVGTFHEIDDIDFYQFCFSNENSNDFHFAIEPNIEDFVFLKISLFDEKKRLITIYEIIGYQQQNHDYFIEACTQKIYIKIETLNCNKGYLLGVCF